MAVGTGSFHTVALKSSYRFGGFFGPVNAALIVNTLQAGAGVPVSEVQSGRQPGPGHLASGYRFHVGTRAAPTPAPTKSSGP
jgi:hypothetical protein